MNIPIKRTWVITILAILIIVFVVLAIATSIHTHPPQTTTVAPTQSSSEETVDANISLAPQNTTVSSTIPSGVAIISPPTTAPKGCNLNLTFAITGGNFNIAGTMNYSLESKNVGSATCTSPSISLYYANNENYQSSNPAATADGYYWRMPNLAPGSEYNIAVVTNRSAPLSSGAVVDEACLSANNGADSCANATANATTTQATPTVVVNQTSFSPTTGKEFGVWVWTPVDQMTNAQMQQTINEAAANNFTAIYLTVDDELTTTNITAYDQSLEYFIGLANQKGISVDAESGSRNWAEAGNTQNAPNIMAFVNSFNESHSGKFRGIQYDIEPYLLPQYQTNQAGVLTDYVNLVETLVNQDKADHIPLTIIVPDFYTATQQWTPEITVDGITAYTYDHIVRLLNELSGSRIIVMAYRNTPSGSNGSIALSTPEIQGADNSNVTVLIAQETGPVTPAYVTFNGLSRASLFSAAGAIDQAFANDKSFGGIAVDYLNPFLNLP